MGRRLTLGVKCYGFNSKERTGISSSLSALCLCCKKTICSWYMYTLSEFRVEHRSLVGHFLLAICMFGHYYKDDEESTHMRDNTQDLED